MNKLDSTAASWWPNELGVPSTSGSLEGLRYAYFPTRQLLLIERQGSIETYDMEDYQFRGVLQCDGGDGALSFLSQKGRVALQDLFLIK